MHILGAHSNPSIVVTIVTNKNREGFEPVCDGVPACDDSVPLGDTRIRENMSINGVSNRPSRSNDWITYPAEDERIDRRG